MSVRQFLDVVPQSVKTAAGLIAGGGILIGLGIAWVTGDFSRGSLGAALAHGIGFGLLAGIFISIWILGLGYVNADARRRGMPRVLWTLIAAFIPNLLGFLLYFALRQPIASPCPQCGRGMKAEQRFCSWCGYEGISTVSATP
jgi:hypothetical protein